MNRIAKRFKELENQNEKALVAYLTAGDPDYEMSLEILKSACDGGVDVLELGMPFSDPTADGPVIQEASLRALRAGMNLEKSLEMAAALRAYHPEVPIILFSYYNPLLQMGGPLLYQRCLEAGIDGLLIVDLPPEEADELSGTFPDSQALPLIRLIAPTTPAYRKHQVAADAEGFLYLITRTGVTGQGGLDVQSIARHSAELREKSSVPVCLGFGISTPDDIRQLAPHADGLVVGSALVKIVAENSDAKDLPDRVKTAVQTLKAACRSE